MSSRSRRARARSEPSPDEESDDDFSDPGLTLVLLSKKKPKRKHRSKKRARPKNLGGHHSPVAKKRRGGGGLVIPVRVAQTAPRDSMGLGLSPQQTDDSALHDMPLLEGLLPVKRTHRATAESSHKSKIVEAGKEIDGQKDGASASVPVPVPVPTEMQPGTVQIPEGTFYVVVKDGGAIVVDEPEKIDKLPGRLCRIDAPLVGTDNFSRRFVGLLGAQTIMKVENGSQERVEGV